LRTWETLPYDIALLYLHKFRQSFDNYIPDLKARHFKQRGITWHEIWRQRNFGVRGKTR
jgi:hypothetical protein